MAARRLTSEAREARRQDIVQRVEAGESQREIAAQLGISRSLVQKELRAMGDARPTPGARRRTNAVPVKAGHGRAAATIVKASSSSGVAVVGSGLQGVMPPPDHYGKWQRLDLDRNTWGKVDPTELVSLLLSISPDMSRAVWDYLRLLNSGHEITAYRLTDDSQDTRAQAALDELIGRLEVYHGSFKAIAGRLFMAAITRGAFFAELVLDETGRIPIDIATPDPATVRFKRVVDEERGEVWMPGQWQNGEFVIFDSPTVRYIALDPEPGVPYGRPMLGPAIFPTVFLIGLLHDLRRVIAQQGYPRTNIILDLERLRSTYRELALPEFEKKVNELLQAVSADYAQLEPDDAFVNTDTVKVERASGAVDTSVMEGAGAVIEAVERMAVRALKTMPLLMGSAEGTSEANANRQWEIFGESLTHLQHYAETILEDLLTLGLRVQGIQARVDVTFAGVRGANELRDEQTQQLRLQNAITAENQGYLGRDEASEYAVGAPAATDSPVRDAEAGDSGPLDGDEVEAEPGENRIAFTNGMVWDGAFIPVEE